MVNFDVFVMTYQQFVDINYVNVFYRFLES